MADALLDQSAIDRLKSAAFELVIEGPFYREREKPPLETSSTKPQRSSTSRRQLDRGA
jgi:hypothetical protein